MYLKSIHAQGFKSFAEKTEIELNDNITGVVGPNGSGKSNVVDAIRWVLGEQSIKSLRGDGNMTDVIFSGSKTRNPSNIATVTLTFDNKDRFLNLDFDLIAIKRRLYKDGTNEYYINNEKVRLKDVTDLLLDSGMAKESFNIISQGKIEEILSSKASDRRVVFEEAACVLKYKKRKEESLRKLDKTTQNMERVNDIINELDLQIGPLKEQKEQATLYQNLKSELEKIEISLVSNDITTCNFEYQRNKQLIIDLQKEIDSISTSNRLSEAKVLEFKQKIDELDKTLRQKQHELITLNQSLEQLNSRKTIINERVKYQVSSKVYDTIVELKETSLKLKSEIEEINLKRDNLKDDQEELNNSLSECNKKNNLLKLEKQNINLELNKLLKQESNLNYQAEMYRHNIENNSSIPTQVKKVLENPKLTGIHDVVGNLFEVDEKYSKAISVALLSTVTNVVVDNSTCAKEAVLFLKQNHLSRVTFLPLDIIKPRNLDVETSKLESIKVASDLVFYDKKYQNIILSLLGNVIVVDDIDEANKMAKQINYRYKIVTLDGEVINVGGSITGGKLNISNSVLDKYKLEDILNQLKDINNKIGLQEEKGNHVDTKLKEQEDKIYLINKSIMNKSYEYNNFNTTYNEKLEKLKIIELDLISNNNLLDNKVDQEQEMIMNEYYQMLELKNKVSLDYEKNTILRNSINEDLNNYEFSVKRENSLFNDKNNELKKAEILVNRLDVKLDNLLQILNETYSITYEEAIKKYILEIDVNTARNQVASLKRKINELGVVNIAAISEYDKVSERLEFLQNQKNDLDKARDILLDIISQMDEIMKKEFMETFEIIKENFKITFKELFKGGSADLKLTDESNILETGIEIVASPPGKSLRTISLLSGGEKTFTAISLLFAILKSKPVPFCIFDEVEAALDDVNVDSFGKYIRNLKDKTQFILITHKKKTMEYVDTLYGITMQESGVSKLVSVKLEEIEK